MDEINRKRLEWVAKKPVVSFPTDLFGFSWGEALSASAQAALGELESMRRWKAEHIADWRPIDEAPIPDHELVPIYWHYPCLIQDEVGAVFAGFARYTRQNNHPNATGKILRWYEGTPVRFGVITKAKYFQPLPQPRKD